MRYTAIVIAWWFMAWTSGYSGYSVIGPFHSFHDCNQIRLVVGERTASACWEGP